MEHPKMEETVSKTAETWKYADNDKNNEKDTVSLQNRTTSPGEGTCRRT